MNFKDIDPIEYLEYLRDTNYDFNDDGKELLGILLMKSFIKEELGNPFNYNRFNEFRQGRKHGYKLTKVGGGSDGVSLSDSTKTAEFKLGEYKGVDKRGRELSQGVAYNGTTRKSILEEQIELCRKKCLRDEYHYWDFVNYETGDFIKTYKIKNTEVLKVLLPKQINSWHNSKDADPRINAGLSTKMLDDNNINYELIRHS